MKLIILAILLIVVLWNGFASLLGITSALMRAVSSNLSSFWADAVKRQFAHIVVNSLVIGPGAGW